MEKHILEEVTCPICIETLKPPIRMLSCGHNLCEECLKQLCMSGKTNCPTCRKVFSVGANGVQSLPRNRVVENIVDQLLPKKETKITKETTNKTTSHDAAQMKELIKKSMDKEKFFEAMTLIKRILSRADGFDKLSLMIDLAMCLLKTEQIQQAKDECDIIAHMINSCEFETDSRLGSNNIDDKLRKLARLFLRRSEYESATLMVGLSVNIIDGMCDNQAKLYKYANTSYLVMDAALIMDKRNKSEEASAYVEIMENISDKAICVVYAHEEFKCLKVTWCVGILACCCIVTKDFSRAGAIIRKAIKDMETMFGKKACRYKVFGHLYQNLGLTHAKKNENTEAMKMYERALQIYACAKDWNGRNEKSSTIARANRNLVRMQNADKNNDAQTCCIIC